MGNTASSTRSKTELPSEYVNQFSDDEIERLETVFKPLVIDNNRGTLDRTRLKGILNAVLSERISERLCEIMVEASQSKQRNKRCEELSWLGLLAVIVQFLKCSYVEQCRILMRLATRNPHNVSESETVTTRDMIELVSDFLKSYFDATKRTQQYRSWENGIESTETEKLSLFLLNDLFFGRRNTNRDGDISDKKFDLHDVEDWFSRSPLAARIFLIVFRTSLRMTTNDEREDSLLPICSCANWTKVRTILTISEILLLNQNLPTSVKNKWRYLFSSRQYGESFSQLLGKIVGRGPTLLVVRDKKGTVFGGFASHSWQTQSKFYGSNECFLFSLKPRIGIYPSTGYNDHYMYLNVNQQTMPNGIGMGGQFEYFGLHVSDNYGKGTCSKSCTTYESPQLSPDTEFEMDTIEVWGVGPEPEPETSTRRSALDSLDPELKAILEMVGKSPISDDIRKADAKEETIPE